MSILNGKIISVFASGLVCGSAGLKLLASKDAKTVYTHCVAAGLRVKDCVMDTVTKVQENAEDILAEAKQINEERAAKEEVIESEEEAAE